MPIHCSLFGNDLGVFNEGSFGRRKRKPLINYVVNGKDSRYYCDAGQLLSVKFYGPSV